MLDAKYYNLDFYILYLFDVNSETSQIKDNRGKNRLTMASCTITNTSKTLVTLPFVTSNLLCYHSPLLLQCCNHTGFLVDPQTQVVYSCFQIFVFAVSSRSILPLDIPTWLSTLRYSLQVSRESSQ